jgi:lipopolysaccharide/colanic/teichoic acid biosynthesis glycosyltransferase
VIGIIVCCRRYFLILAMLIKFNDPDAPVMYRHRRLSRNGLDVYVLKFRTMSVAYSQLARAGHIRPLRMLSSDGTRGSHRRV